MIYLDYNATTPLAPEVAEAMIPCLKGYFGNPSSSHLYGRQAKKIVEEARKQLASLLNCKVNELVFTSGGSESNNFALKGYALANQHKGKHIITSAIEHPAITEVCKYLESLGFDVTYLPVDSTGRVRVEDVARSIRRDTILISIMYANNEVGTLQPIPGISALAKQHNIVLHSDCAQAVGKIPVDIQELGVDLLSVAGHKFYGPKGVGVLYIREGIQLQKLIDGADHERNQRAGTENIMAIVGLGKAAVLAKEGMNSHIKKEKELRERLRTGLSKIKNVQFNGNTEFCLPNTLSVSFKDLRANDILAETKNIAASAGAACHAESVNVSATLAAMNIPVEYAMGTVRLSVGRYTTEDEIDMAVKEIIRAVGRLRQNG